MLRSKSSNSRASLGDHFSLQILYHQAHLEPFWQNLWKSMKSEAPGMPILALIGSGFGTYFGRRFWCHLIIPGVSPGGVLGSSSKKRHYQNIKWTEPLIRIGCRWRVAGSNKNSIRKKIIFLRFYLRVPKSTHGESGLWQREKARLGSQGRTKILENATDTACETSSF